MSGEDWYSPAQIRFTGEQIDWIAENYEFFNEGKYPPKYSGYIGFGGMGRKGRSYFETPVIIIAEFHSRLDRCGRDGWIFRFTRCLKYDEKIISILAGVDLNYIRVRNNKVRSYISGRRKSVSYPEFLKHKKDPESRSPRLKIGRNMKP